MRCFNCGDIRGTRSLRGWTCRGCGHDIKASNQFSDRRLVLFGEDKEEVTDPEIVLKEQEAGNKTLESEKILELTEEMMIPENIIFSCDNEECLGKFSINKERHPYTSENLMSCPRCGNIIVRC